MKLITPQEIIGYVEAHIPQFHQNRLEKLKKLKLEDVLERKNPYLFKAKNINTAGELVKNILDAFLSSSEEGVFGGFLEELAIFICGKTLGGKKSSAEGIDLEFERDQTKYIVSIKSGPSWGNSSQIKKMKDHFKQAKRILGANLSSTMKVVAINGCCYGRDNQFDKGDYLKLCGQRFWTFISADEALYTKIIEPLGHQAKKKNDQFMEKYGKVANKFTLEFIQKFCDTDGKILWDEVVQFNASQEKSLNPRGRTGC